MLELPSADYDLSDRKKAVQEYETKSYKDLAILFRELRDKKAKLKSELRTIEAKIDALTVDVIPDKLAEDGFKNVRVDGVGQIKLSTQAFCSTRAGMSEAVREWMVEHGFGELVTETINPATLKSFIKEQMEHGGDVPPDDLINFQPYSRATVVK